MIRDRVIMIADKCEYMKKKECYGQSVPSHSFFIVILPHGENSPLCVRSV